jgi:hypothetical protein
MILEQKQPKKKGGARPGAGHPVKEINWSEIELAAEKQWNLKQLAALVGCDVKTLVAGIQRQYGIESSAYLAIKKEVGWARLLTKQYDMAMDGSVALLIWLGKNYLGQSDKQHIEQEVSGNVTSNLNLKNLTDDELFTMNALLKKAGTQ